MTRSTRGSITARRIAVVVLPAMIALTGCRAAEPGAAATVGSRRIDVWQVQSAYQDILPVVGPDAQLTQSDVLNWLILQPYVLQAAAENNVAVSAEDARNQFRSASSSPHPGSAALDAVESALAINRLQNGSLPSEKVQEVFQGVIAQLKSAKVEVSPRYGSGYDASKLQVLSKTGNWLPAPAVSATPTPSP